MSTPDPLAQQFQQLQIRLNELHDQMKRAGEAVSSRPLDGYTLFKDLQEEVDAVYREYEEYVHQLLAIQSNMPVSDDAMSGDYAEWARQLEASVRMQELNDKGWVLSGMSQAALLLGKLDEGLQISEQLKLLGEEGAQMSTSGLPPQQIQQLQVGLNELQERQNDITEKVKRAAKALRSRPSEAYTLFKNLSEEMKAVHRADKEFMRQLQATSGDAALGDYATRQEAEWMEQGMLQTEIMVMGGMSQAALLLGKLDEAQQVSEQHLKLLGEQPSLPRVLVLGELGAVCFQLGSLKKAQSYFEQARAAGTELGDWVQVSLALSSLSLCAQLQGDRRAGWDYLNKAIQIARDHELPEVQSWLQTQGFTLWLERDATGELLQQQKQQGKNLYLELLEEKASTLDTKLLVAAYLVSIRAFNDAEGFFAQAEKLAQGDPVAESKVLQEKAKFYESQGSISEAIKQAEQALHKILETQASMLIGQSLLTLITLRLASDDPNQQRQADQEIEELRTMGKDGNLAPALLDRALIHLNQKHPDLALKDVEEAETCRVELEERRGILTARSEVLQALGRKEEALQVSKEAIEYYREQQIPADGPSLTRWSDLVEHLDALYTHTASLVREVEPGNLREAFEWAEKGKSQILRHQLAWAGRGESDTSPQLANVVFDELHALLSRESTALAMFNLANRDSSVFLIHPQEPEPEYHKIDLTLDELKEILPKHPSEVSASEKLFEALPQLSKRLLPPLREIVKHCSTLYLIPSSLLYTLPFAALTFDDGTYLIQHCALASVPTAAVLEWCYARRSTLLERSCLAVGVGSTPDKDGINIAFAQQARDIAALTGARLLSETTTARKFLEEAQHFSVLHLACHGSLDPNASALQASFIQLADRLTTQSVFDSRLNAELVFLNACLSGSFQLRMREEIGGFWQAFLVAGATSLIATLFKVDPNKAQQLALNFYGEWLKGGVSKAEALRRAQCRMLISGAKPHEWATHILIGDHR